MATDPYILAATWLWSVLGNDGTLATLATKIYPKVVPTNAPWKAGGGLARYVVITPPPRSSDTLAIGGRRYIESELLYTVKVVARTLDEADVQDVVERIDTLLSSAEPAAIAGGGWLNSCARVDGVNYLEENDNGVRYLHLGARYAIDVSPEGV
jgi:hypothetical protein